MKARRGTLVVLLLAGLGAAVYFGTRLVVGGPPDEALVEEEEALEPDRDLPPGQRFEKVRATSREVFDTFPGRISAGRSVPVYAPVGMRVAVAEVVRDQGDVVKKGDVLVRFHKPQIEKAIEQARAAGNAADEQRFRGYLENWELRSPVDGIVSDVWRIEGEVPIDPQDGKGIPVAEVSDPDDFSLRVAVPSHLTKTLAAIGSRLVAELEGTNGTAEGTVTGYEPGPSETTTTLVVGLDPREGLEKDMVANLRVPTSKVEAALVPKAAVRDRAGVKVVRVWEPSDRSIAERTILVDGEAGGDYVVRAGVFPGESVVVER